MLTDAFWISAANKPRSRCSYPHHALPNIAFGLSSVSTRFALGKDPAASCFVGAAEAMPRRLVFHDLREFRALYWQGVPEARIARCLGVDRDVVRRIMKELGLTPRSYRASNGYLAGERTPAQRQAMTAALARRDGDQAASRLRRGRSWVPIEIPSCPTDRQRRTTVALCNLAIRSAAGW